MIFKDKNILLISPEPWDHIFVSKHHYAIHLGKGENKVFFLNPPSNDESVRKTEHNNVFSLSYRGFPGGLRFFPSFLQKYFIRQKFNELQELCGVKFDIVWSFDNSVFFDFSALPKDILKISHIVDLNQNFQTEKAAATADYCFCTTDFIKDRLLAFNSKVFKINHGFNASVPEIKPVVLPGNSATKVLYAGNLSMPYIDWMLIHVLVNGNQDTDFIFVGPDNDNYKKDYVKQDVRELQNTFFVGRIKSDDLLSYYKSSDILLVAYQESYHSDQSNPHKMMEYLGSGKLPVTTFTAEYAELNNNLLLMSNCNAELPLKFKQALDNLVYWNSIEKQQLRKVVALDNTYEKQLERIGNCLRSMM